MSVWVGVDWGGTYVKLGLVDCKGKILDKIIYSSGELKKKKVFISKLKSLLTRFKKFKIKGIGIGAPGIVNIRKGFVYYLPNIPGWKDYPLGQILKKELSLPVSVDNDANVFALAEARLGAAKGYSRGIFLTLGTGLGGAVILDGKIFHGTTSASELGHVPISLEGKLCSCGSRGCIETFVGSRYLLQRYKELKKRDIKIREIKDIFDKANNGEKAALVVWKEFSLSLGRFLSGMVNVFNPQVIVLGGGISGAFNLFRPLLWKVIKNEAMWPQIKGLKIVRAKLRYAGIIGAALLAKESQMRPYPVSAK